MNLKTLDSNSKTVAVIVAHPDDETLWTGGTILNHPSWKCFIVCLSRVNDKDRSSKFYNALKILKSEGIMGDLDDGPEQIPLEENEIEQAKRIWLRKYRIITETYGFEKNGFEAETTPRAESFWKFSDPVIAKEWLYKVMNLKI